MILPQEIKEEILSYLWDDKKTLRACALTSCALVNPSQKLLFAKTSLVSATTYGLKSKRRRLTARRFEKILKANPLICQYVQHLEVHDKDGVWLPKDKSVPRILPQLVNLRVLDIQYNAFSSCDVGSLSARFFAALISVMHRPNFTSLTLSEFPRALLKHGQHLTHLSFDEFISQDLPSTSCTTCNGKLSLDSLYIQSLPDDDEPDFLPALRNNIEIKKIRRLFAAALDHMGSHETLFSILQECKDSLKELAFQPCSFTFEQATVDQEPIDYSILTSLRTFTTRIELSAYDDGEDEDISFTAPFIWLLRVLKKLSSTNKSLEELNIQFNYTLEQKADELPCWDDLKILLLDKAHFPGLRRVNFRIASFLPDDLDDIVEEVEKHVEWLSEESKGRLKVSLSVVERS